MQVAEASRKGLREGSPYVHLKYEGIKTKTQFVSSSRLRIPVEFAKTGQCDRSTVYA